MHRWIRPEIHQGQRKLTETGRNFLDLSNKKRLFPFSVAKHFVTVCTNEYNQASLWTNHCEDTDVFKCGVMYCTLNIRCKSLICGVTWSLGTDTRTSTQSLSRWLLWNYLIVTQWLSTDSKVGSTHTVLYTGYRLLFSFRSKVECQYCNIKYHIETTQIHLLLMKCTRIWIIYTWMIYVSK